VPEPEAEVPEGVLPLLMVVVAASLTEASVAEVSMPLLFLSVLPPPHADSNTAAAQTPVSVVTEKARRVVDTN
jgi:hypothetical protein